MPTIPAHLLHWVAPTGVDAVPDTRVVDHQLVRILGEKGTALEALVRCPCGSGQLEFHYPGKTHHHAVTRQPIPCAIHLSQPDGQPRECFAILAVCATCQKQCVLFDAELHGWHPATNAELLAQNAKLPRPPLTAWKCLQCGHNVHAATLGCVFESAQDFRDLTHGTIPPERRADAFTWFSLALECCGCGRETGGWVDYETA